MEEVLGGFSSKNATSLPHFKPHNIRFQLQQPSSIFDDSEVCLSIFPTNEPTKENACVLGDTDTDTNHQI